MINLSKSSFPVNSLFLFTDEVFFSASGGLPRRRLQGFFMCSLLSRVIHSQQKALFTSSAGSWLWITRVPGQVCR